MPLNTTRRQAILGKLRALRDAAPNDEARDALDDMIPAIAGADDLDSLAAGIRKIADPDDYTSGSPAWRAAVAYRVAAVVIEGNTPKLDAVLARRSDETDDAEQP